MNYQLKLTDDAKKDTKDASVWYNNKRENLGAEFIGNVEEVLTLIQQNPYQFALINNVRKVPIKRFPYLILYVILAKEIVVFGVFHTSRNTKVWKERTIKTT